MSVLQEQLPDPFLARVPPTCGDRAVVSHGVRWKCADCLDKTQRCFIWLTAWRETARSGQRYVICWVLKIMTSVSKLRRFFPLLFSVRVQYGDVAPACCQ